MKLLSIILQSSKGQSILIVCANNFLLTDSINYSYLIYQHIIDCYRNNVKVQRYISLTTDRYSLNNITKDFILSVIVSKNDLMLGYDGLRKLSDYFNRNIRIDSIMKKIVELFGVFEEFLYTRQLPLGDLILSARPDKTSKKQKVDLQILTRLPRIHLEPEKRALVEIQLRQAKIDEMNSNVKNQVVRNGRNFCIKVFEEENISTDIVKENFIVNYKNRLFANSFGKRKPELITLPVYEEETPTASMIFRKKENSSLIAKTSIGSIGQQSTQPLLPRFKESTEASTPMDTQSSILFTEEQTPSKLKHNGQKTESDSKQNLTILPKLQLKPPVPEAQISFMDVFTIPSSPRPSEVNLSVVPKIRMNEKLQLVLVDQKVKNISQYGQIAIELNSLQKISIMLTSPNWLNKKYLITRVTPDSFKTKQLQSNVYQIQVDEVSKSKGVIDYIINKQTFNYNKIPLMFVSTFETRKNTKQNIIEFTFKYKVNDKWKGSLHDIDIQIVLDPFIIFSDCKTNPLANSLKGKVVNWKAKELTENAKGKLSLALYDPTIPPKDIVKQIKLIMRSEKSLLPELDVQFCGGINKSKAKKHLIIQYKILPK